MILVVGFYSDPDPGRLREFFECLSRNESNPYIRGIHVLAEDSAAAMELEHWLGLGSHSKSTLVTYGRRLTFQSLFAYVNEHLSGQRVIVANTDIFFDATLGRLESCDLTGMLLCLSRWDVQPDGTSDPWSEYCAAFAAAEV